jgi:hypothetical protein
MHPDVYGETLGAESKLEFTAHRIQRPPPQALKGKGKLEKYRLPVPTPSPVPG